MPPQFTVTFLTRAYTAAKESNHLFPDYAACESALESSWGRSELCTRANNLFGSKRPHDRPLPEGCSTLSLPTREFLHGEWVTVPAEWVSYPTWSASFRDRMHSLQTLSASFPHYEAALNAANGEAFIEQVSRSWSTDPERAEKVLSIRRAHAQVFGATL